MLQKNQDIQSTRKFLGLKKYVPILAFNENGMNNVTNEIILKTLMTQFATRL